MPIYRAEVEYDDDGASMAGANCGTIRRAGVFELEAKDKSFFADELRTYFRNNMHYASIRRIGNVLDAQQFIGSNLK